MRPTRRARHRQRLAALHTEPGIQCVLAAAALTTALCSGNLGRRVRRYGPLSGPQQSKPVIRVKLQRLSQAAQRMEMRVPPNTTFQVRDPAHTEAGAVGQRLLRQPSRQPLSTKQFPKGAPPIHLRHLLQAPPRWNQGPRCAHQISRSITALLAAAVQSVAPTGDAFNKIANQSPPKRALQRPARGLSARRSTGSGRVTSDYQPGYGNGSQWVHFRSRIVDSASGVTVQTGPWGGWALAYDGSAAVYSGEQSIGVQRATLNSRYRVMIDTE